MSHHLAKLLSHHPRQHHLSPGGLIPTSFCYLCSSRRIQKKIPTGKTRNYMSTFPPRHTLENAPLRASHHKLPSRLQRIRILSRCFQNMDKRSNMTRSISLLASENMQRMIRWSSSPMKLDFERRLVHRLTLGQDDWSFHRILPGHYEPRCSTALEKPNTPTNPNGSPAIPWNHTNSHRLPSCRWSS